MAKTEKGIKEYWIQVLIACSQVTFGVAWAALFVPPFDTFKVIVLIFNLFASLMLWLIGWLISNRR